MPTVDGELERECVDCDLVFKKKKGPWKKWRMGTLEAFLDEEIGSY